MTKLILDTKHWSQCVVLRHVYDVCDVSIATRNCMKNIQNIYELLELLNRHPNKFNQRYSHYTYLQYMTSGVATKDEDYNLESFFHWLADYTKYKTINPLVIGGPYQTPKIKKNGKILIPESPHFGLGPPQILRTSAA